MLVAIDKTRFINTNTIVSVNIEDWYTSDGFDENMYYVRINTLTPAIVETTKALTWEEANQLVAKLMNNMSK